MYCCRVLSGIGLCGVIMETSAEACLGVMLLLMSMGIWVGSCLSFLSRLDILARVHSGMAYMPGMCVMGGISWVWIGGGQRCWRVLVWRRW